MPDADAPPPTEPGSAKPSPADPDPAPTTGLVTPALTPLVTLGSEDADACSDGLCS